MKNFCIKEVHVEPRVIQTDWTLKMGTPVFGMSKSAQKEYGMSKKDYNKWQKQMKKLWKKKLTN